MLFHRFAVLLLLPVFITVTPAFADDSSKGPMEKAGEFLDKGLEKGADFFSDAAVTTRIKKRLFADDKVSGFEIKITTRDGSVIVEGEIESEKLARRALEIVRNTEGVKSAENHMTLVSKSSSSAR